VRWIWDAKKNRSNKRAHGLSFETAEVVFDDPMQLSKLDPFSEEERWQTVGVIGEVTIFVVHTWPEEDQSGELVGRIISARKATRREREAYEEGEF
jgi:uncharacterized protein